jgi:hypothetical protein
MKWMKMMNRILGLFLFWDGSPVYCTLEIEELVEFLNVNNLQTIPLSVNGSQDVFKDGLLVGYVM